MQKITELKIFLFDKDFTEAEHKRESNSNYVGYLQDIKVLIICVGCCYKVTKPYHYFSHHIQNTLTLLLLETDYFRVTSVQDDPPQRMGQRLMRLGSAGFLAESGEFRQISLRIVVRN